jgi:uncharacterized protein (TIGR00251 family)
MKFGDQVEVFSKDGMACLRVRVQPRSSKNEVVGMYNTALKIRLTAPPLDDRANHQLRKFLAKLLQLGMDDVVVLSGLRARTKTIGIVNLSKSELLDRLAQYLV